MPSPARTTGIITPTAQHLVHSPTESAATTLSGKHRLDRESMSPTKRTKRWVEGPTPSQKTVIHRAKGSKITKPSSDKQKKRSSFWGLPLLAKFFSKQQTSEVDDLEGDTILDGDAPIPTLADDNDFTLVADGNDYDEEVIDHKTERTLQDYRNDSKLEYNDPRFKEWTEDENWFFAKLRKRGREPLFDQTWAMDFPTYPDSVFTKDPNQVLINSTNGTSYSGKSFYTFCIYCAPCTTEANTILIAIRAFDNLARAGGNVRAQITGGAIPEKPLLRAINEYYKWSLTDAKLKHKAHIPVTAIACAKPRESTESVLGRVTDQLHDLSRQYRDKWRHPDCKESDVQQRYTHSLPTLFGFVIKYTVVAIVTCDSSVPGSPVRTLNTADWRVITQNVWHAIAVAIAFIVQRDYLMQLDDEGELGPEIIEEESDPDA